MNHRSNKSKVSSEIQTLPSLGELVTKAIISTDSYSENLTKAQQLEMLQKKARALEEKHHAELIAVAEEAKAKIPDLVKGELEKNAIIKKNEAMRYRIPYNINNNNNPDRKVGADVPSSYLRRMSILYPIARACINYRIRQMTQLEWDITTIDEVEGEDGYEAQIEAVENFFKHPMGHKTRLRQMLTIMVDDILTIDATCFEIAHLRGGEFDPSRGLKPVDPATICLLVDEQGGTPLPPETAYRQIIDNAVIAAFDTDHMIYYSMAARSYNPYGISPLESLILQAESALRGTIYNLNYFRESNVPEGFITLPEDAAANKEQAEEWQMWFDAIMAGDPRMLRRLKILPYGSTYTAAKKPEDMSFEKFEMWLLTQTCAMFDVQPQDIGITLNINKASAKSQQDIGQGRGKIPMANFLKEIFDDIIQYTIGFDKLQWIFRNLNPVDRLQEAQINDTKIKNGTLSVDDARINDGLPPIGLREYIMTPQGPILVDDLITGKYKVLGDNNPADKIPVINTDDEKDLQPNDEAPDDLSEKAEQKEIKAWRRAIYTDLDKHKSLRIKFPTAKISKEVHDAISEGLQGVATRHQAKMLFDQFLDPETKQSFKLFKLAETFRQIEESAV